MHIIKRLFFLLLAFNALLANAQVQVFGYKQNSFPWYVNIGNTTPKTTDPSAVLELGNGNDNRGFLPPRGNKNAIASPAKGLQIHDNPTNKPWFFNGTEWVAMGGGTLTAGTPTDTLFFTTLGRHYKSIDSLATLFALKNHTHPWAQITDRPTTKAGYGITDVVEYTDTATMLNPYLRWRDTTAMLDGYLRKRDTIGMALIPQYPLYKNGNRLFIDATVAAYNARQLQDITVKRIQPLDQQTLVYDASVDMWVPTTIAGTGSTTADGNNYATGLNFDNTTGSLSLTRYGLTALNANLDGRYLQSYTETDPQFETKWSAKTTDDLPEGLSNLYYSHTRARQAISLTTTGTTGVSTYNPATGVFNIPDYASAVTDSTTFSTRHYTDSLFATTGGSAAINNANQGSGLPLLDSSTQKIKTVFGTNGVLIDSTTNANALTWQIDSTKYSTRHYTDSLLTTTGGSTGTITINQGTGIIIPQAAAQSGTPIWTINADTTTLGTHNYITNIYNILNNGKQPTINASNTPNQYWNGYKQFVTLNTDSAAEGSTNKFYTDARARAAISLTTTGTSGAATYNASTGVLNIPNYATSGGGTNNANVGTGNRWLIPSTQEIKTAFAGSGVLIDSTSNTNGLTYKTDTTLIATKAYVDNHAGSSGGGTATPDTVLKSIAIINPTNAENIDLFYTTRALTIQSVYYATSGTSPGVTFNIYFSATRDGTPTKIYSLDVSGTSTSGASAGSRAVSIIPAGSWVWFITSAISGTPTRFGISINYTKN